jgi:hypothetical protein
MWLAAAERNVAAGMICAKHQGLHDRSPVISTRGDRTAFVPAIFVSASETTIAI